MGVCGGDLMGLLLVFLCNRWKWIVGDCGVGQLFMLPSCCLSYVYVRVCYVAVGD